ncbi:hypothetical protein IAQ61_002945 [Plenodomus lingam]|uniref:Uncharacterized protein n=1 Tax=Leptosphaeria maculans (strain JN3 / isolate v23.1.3 / race Av1-4-5-6-7-8) TaxID=985895 RepID=E5A878_LEPMJ|nr:hypothetical protein LEMA_P074120.1 [Plenodomus lingam JN3]KAH9877578.1 hypothetical protein IAQ61_002945 [Plenodomus lingam]CBX99823.1 hypothetical protein LEMA_P074120.1 [Plenodomus lingam JN3]
MGDDWQDAAFSTRHMHNRVGGHGKSSRTKAFDVQKVFGSYSVKCAAWQKRIDTSAKNLSDQSSGLEFYRLTENGEGVIGKLVLPFVLNAAVILAASRASLQRTVADVEDDGIEEDTDAPTIDSLPEDSEGDPDQNTFATDRFSTFDKNSFRSPKFWLQWSGTPMTEGTSVPEHTADVGSGLGYVVFTGNDCHKFKGTLNCAALQWKDVAITGHKITSRSATDIPVVWIPDRHTI